jgi:leucyl aminopeptidase
MELILTSSAWTAVETGAVVCFCWSDELPNDDLAGGLARELCEKKEFEAKAGETALIHRPQGLKARRLLLAGLGEKARSQGEEMRKAAASALRTLKSRGVREILFVLPAPLGTEKLLQAAVEGTVLGDFEPDRHKTDPTKGEKRVDQARFYVDAESIPLVEALRRGRIIAEAQNFARTLANEPANHLTPLKLAEAARQMASEFGLGCEVLDEARMRQLGMGSLLGVAQGSAEPPCLIVVRYEPAAGAAAGAPHLALVGKGVTFDTGGISIKPSDGMEKMKYDMSGAAAVLGAMRALAQLRPAVPVTAFAPCVENMPSHRAQRPGDIVTSYLGKTIEVLNTDAEGRLILADALTYASRLGCTHMVDAATLTGAVAVALAHVHVGLFANDEAFLGRVRAAAHAAGEKMWPLPLDEDYKELLKSSFADIANIGGRFGGAVTAAKFLEEFVEGKPWAHLDIAGTAWLDEAKPHQSKGPTGVAVRTFVELATSWT